MQDSAPHLTEAGLVGVPTRSSSSLSSAHTCRPKAGHVYLDTDQWEACLHTLRQLVSSGGAGQAVVICTMKHVKLCGSQTSPSGFLRCGESSIGCLYLVVYDFICISFICT